MKRKNIILQIALLTIMIMTITACGAKITEADFTVEELEEALNNGESVNGKTVVLVIDDLVPDSAFGYNMQAGEHLNFVSMDNPKSKPGDTVVVKVLKAGNVFGSWVISYKFE